MKLPAARVDAFVARPDPACAVILLYGPDAGLVGERARRIGLGVVEDLGDPFRVTELDAERLRQEPQLLVEEAQALCLMGGRRLVRVRPAADAATAAVKLLLEAGEPAALVLLEAGDLGGGSSLRRTVESAAGAAALPCYRDEARDLAGLIKSILAEDRLEADRDALDYLVAHLGSDRAVTRQELAKLAVYVGDPPDRTVRLDDVASVIDDNSALAMDDAVSAALLGERDVEARIERLFGEGQRPEALLRVASSTVLRLLRAAVAVEAGTPASAVIDAIRPPVHFRAKATMERALRRWRAPQLFELLARLREAEAGCRRRQAPSALICRYLLCNLATGQVRTGG
ncbi:MAG TPA: DNA polymerase III subunit delta [Geminicoccaceae bacterium]|nr:DNA polymerase III subunit delta [Geminicoccus sp.]HMU50669.1 DNA polymerase III subunit delta [Geminicoccaceae bacterium]